MGTQQSGLFDKIADLVSRYTSLHDARESAKEILLADPRIKITSQLNPSKFKLNH